MTPTHLEPDVSALPSSARDLRAQAVIDAHSGDAELALLATLHEIDRLYARLEAISMDVSVGYCHGRWRKAAAYAVRNASDTPAPQALDL